MMRRFVIAFMIATAAGQLTLVERPPDTIEMCMGANCTTVAFLPNILHTSFALHRDCHTATIVVAYECARRPDLCHVTHSVSEEGACVGGGPLAV